MARKQKNLFLSHIHEDDPGLGKFKELLGKHGMAVRDYSVSADNPNNAHSESYIKTNILGPRIQKSSTLVVYVSEATKESKWVNWEVEYAQKLGKRIVGVWAHGEQGCELPEMLDKYHDALVGWSGSNIVDAITGRTSRSENPDGSERERRRIDRYSCG